MKNLSYVLTLVLFVAFFQSCQKDDPIVDNGVAPTLPPAEMFVMPFTGFEDSDTTGLVAGGGEGDGAIIRTTTYTNWFHSAVNLLVWNTVITVHMAIPVHAFAAALDQDASYEGSGVWLWQYSVTDQVGAVFQIKLYGTLLPDEQVQWDMYVSKAGAYTDFLWYTGVTENDNAGATWTLYAQPNNPTESLQIVYENDEIAGAKSIRFTNILSTDPGNGSYIEHRNSNDPSADFNRAYDVMHMQSDNLLEIQWHETNENGRVKDEAKFGDQEWHCWDTEQMDTDC